MYTIKYTNYITAFDPKNKFYNGNQEPYDFILSKGFTWEDYVEATIYDTNDNLLKFDTFNWTDIFGDISIRLTDSQFVTCKMICIDLDGEKFYYNNSGVSRVIHLQDEKISVVNFTLDHEFTCWNLLFRKIGRSYIMNQRRAYRVKNYNMCLPMNKNIPEVGFTTNIITDNYWTIKDIINLQTFDATTLQYNLSRYTGDKGGLNVSFNYDRNGQTSFKSLTGVHFGNFGFDCRGLINSWGENHLNFTRGGNSGSLTFDAGTFNFRYTCAGYTSSQENPHFGVLVNDVFINLGDMIRDDAWHSVSVPAFTVNPDNTGHVSFRFDTRCRIGAAAQRWSSLMDITIDTTKWDTANATGVWTVSYDTYTTGNVQGFINNTDSSNVYYPTLVAPVDPSVYVENPIYKSYVYIFLTVDNTKTEGKETIVCLTDGDVSAWLSNNTIGKANIIDVCASPFAPYFLYNGTWTIWKQNDKAYFITRNLMKNIKYKLPGIPSLEFPFATNKMWNKWSFKNYGDLTSDMFDLQTSSLSFSITYSDKLYGKWRLENEYGDCHNKNFEEIFAEKNLIFPISVPLPYSTQAFADWLAYNKGTEANERTNMILNTTAKTIGTALGIGEAVAGAVTGVGAAKSAVTAATGKLGKADALISKTGSNYALGKYAKAADELSAAQKDYKSEQIGSGVSAGSSIFGQTIDLVFGEIENWNNMNTKYSNIRNSPVSANMPDDVAGIFSDSRVLGSSATMLQWTHMTTESYKKWEYEIFYNGYFVNEFSELNNCFEVNNGKFILIDGQMYNVPQIIKDIKRANPSSKILSIDEILESMLTIMSMRLWSDEPDMNLI